MLTVRNMMIGEKTSQSTKKTRVESEDVGTIISLLRITAYVYCRAIRSPTFVPIYDLIIALCPPRYVCEPSLCIGEERLEVREPLLPTRLNGSLSLCRRGSSYMPR